MLDLYLFIIGLLTVNSILLLWFFSPLKTSIGKIIFKKTLMPYEFDDLISLKNKWIGELISCWICCSFWCSLAVGIFFVYIFGAVWWYPILTFFCYPCLCYLFYKKIGGN
jgi:hypothetical protein